MSLLYREGNIVRITVENVIRIQKGRVDEVLERFREPKAVHTFDGFVMMEVLRKLESPEYDELKICTTWEDQASFDKWLEHRNYEKAHAQSGKEKPKDSPILGNELSIFEVAIQHEPAE